MDTATIALIISGASLLVGGGVVWRLFVAGKAVGTGQQKIKHLDEEKDKLCDRVKELEDKKEDAAKLTERVKQIEEDQKAQKDDQGKADKGQDEHIAKVEMSISEHATKVEKALKEVEKGAHARIDDAVNRVGKAEGQVQVFEAGMKHITGQIDTLLAEVRSLLKTETKQEIYAQRIDKLEVEIKELTGKLSEMRGQLAAMKQSPARNQQ